MKNNLVAMGGIAAWGRVARALLVAMIALVAVATGTSASPATHSVGNKMYVGGTSALRVRSGPGLGYSIKTVMSRGTRVTIIGGPVSRDGYSWYKVTEYNSSGSSGWSAGKYLYHVGSGSGGGGGSQTGSTYRVEATAYNGAEFGSDGIMANGKRVHWGAVATDPRYIPLGTRMYISGFGDKVFTAEDTGSAIKGYRIDIWFPSVQEALNFGRQTKYVTIIR